MTEPLTFSRHALVEQAVFMSSDASSYATTFRFTYQMAIFVSFRCLMILMKMDYTWVGQSSFFLFCFVSC